MTIQTCYLLHKKPACYLSAKKTQVTELFSFFGDFSYSLNSLNSLKVLFHLGKTPIRIMVCAYDFKAKKLVVIQIISTLNFLSTNLLLCCATESLTTIIIFTTLSSLHTMVIVFIWIYLRDKIFQIRECQNAKLQIPHTVHPLFRKFPNYFEDFL